MFNIFYHNVCILNIKFNIHLIENLLKNSGSAVTHHFLFDHATNDVQKIKMLKSQIIKKKVSLKVK